MRLVSAARGDVPDEWTKARGPVLAPDRRIDTGLVVIRTILPVV
jgi:hypothetical protein